MTSRIKTFATFTTAALAVSAMMVSSGVFAWGSEGHRITGLVAQELMTGKARLRLNDLIPGADLGDIANYMDINRPNLLELIPAIDKWHYDNQPVCQSKTYEQYCAKGECASARVPSLMKLVADASNPPEVRALALRMLVHIVGDIHQPLHAADDSDRGANDKQVLLPGATNPRRLHAVWDTDLVRMTLAGGDEIDFAHQLVLRHRGKDVREWQKGDIKDWMTESWHLSQTAVYSKLPTFACGIQWTATVPLTQEYVDTAVGVIPTQLAKGGARIAAVLNKVLDPNPFGEVPPPATPAAK